MPRRTLGSAATLLTVIAVLVLRTTAAQAAEGTKNLVLIGGPKSHGVGEHDFPNGVALLEEFLNSALQMQNVQDIAVAVHSQNWPSDPAALDNAATIILYFNGIHAGMTSHPLSDAEHRAQFEKAMDRGAGLVALHQAWTVPPDDRTIKLQRWLGAARHGRVDRTFEKVRFKIRPHAVTRGVGELELYDEFYPTFRFIADRHAIAPLLIGNVHIQFRDSQPVTFDRAVERVQAWAFERNDGGRAFGFTGLHFLSSLDEPQLRRLLLNAIFWTAKIDVPHGGVRTAAPTDAAATRLLQTRPCDCAQ